MEKDTSNFKIMETRQYYDRYFDDEIMKPELITNEDAEVLAKVLKPLGGYGIREALYLLECAQTVLIECTQVHDEYIP